MKTIKTYWILFVVLPALLSSCNPNPVESSITDYWNSSTLIRQHLNGNVKSMTYNNGTQTDEFNQQGYITKSTYISTSGVSTTIYNYAATGELISTDFSSTIGTGDSFSISYEYGTFGKYVALQSNNILSTGLVSNLKGVVSPAGRTDYVFKNDSMLLIKTHTVNEICTFDTTVVIYKGKYPKFVTTSTGYIKDMTFADNGMFLTYTECIQGSGTSTEKKYYFKPDNRFLIADSIACNVVSIDGVNHTVTKYVYDANRNVVHEDTSGDAYEYTYNYDSHNNWTSRNGYHKAKGTTNWTTISSISRTITYW